MYHRKPVATAFYDSDPRRLRETLTSLIPVRLPQEPAVAIMVPHAGYIYSGAVAGEVFGSLELPSDFIVLCPNHRGMGARLSIMASGTWETPLGNLPVNKPLAEALLAECSEAEDDVIAHLQEHAIEVELPFIQHLHPEATIVPISVSLTGFGSLETFGHGLARAIKRYGKPVLLVASSDMSHYISAEEARQRDFMALEPLLKLDPRSLYETVVRNRITMCGILPATASLIAAKDLGATKARLVRYTHSGEASGDFDHVVGYAGVVIS